MKTDEELIYEQYDTIQQIMSRIKNGKIEGDVDLGELYLQKLPDLSQVEVTGDFYCGENNLTSLAGAPHTVGGSFVCIDNKLTSLVGAPHTVGGNFGCDGNNLTSLSGAPHTVVGDFSCSYTGITSLSGAPHTVGGSFWCLDSELASLEGISPHIGVNVLIRSATRITFTDEEVQQAIQKAQQDEMKHHARNDDSMVTDLLDF